MTPCSVLSDAASRPTHRAVATTYPLAVVTVARAAAICVHIALNNSGPIVVSSSYLSKHAPPRRVRMAGEGHGGYFIGNTINALTAFVSPVCATTARTYFLSRRESIARPSGTLFVNAPDFVITHAAPAVLVIVA